MDLDGLEQLMKAQHTSVMDKLNSVEQSFKEQRTFCDGRFDAVEEDVKKHERCIQRSKGIVTILGTIWAAITTLAALVAPYFWR